jgi:antitoxin YefM
MDAKTFEDAVATLDRLMDQASDNAEPIVITRTGKPAAVLVSLDEWNSLQEMLNLARSPVNRARLNEAIRDADAGKSVERELVGK